MKVSGCPNYSGLTLSCQHALILDGRGEIEDIPGCEFEQKRKQKWNIQSGAVLRNRQVLRRHWFSPNFQLPTISTTLHAVDQLSKICDSFLGCNYCTCNYPTIPSWNRGWYQHLQLHHQFDGSTLPCLGSCRRKVRIENDPSNKFKGFFHWYCACRV